MEYFDVDKFLKVFLKRQLPIETKHLSDWIGCSLRHIQKFGKLNDVPYHRIHGIKYYIWNETNIRKFGKWFNRKHDKIIKEKEPGINTRKPEPKPKQKKIHKPDYRTVKDLVIELYGTKDDDKIYLFQKWCRIFNVPFQYHFGRKYYIISDEIREIFIKLENDKKFYYEVFQKKKYDIYGKKHGISDKDLSILIDIHNN
jgi:hypothetical protein